MAKKTFYSHPKKNSKLQQLQSDFDNYKRKNEVNVQAVLEARKENERLREALRFYAKESTYWYVENPSGKLLKGSRINKDLGSLARLALAGDSNE